MRTSYKANLLTGIMLIVTGVALAGLLLYLQDMRPGVTGSLYYIEFPSAPNIKKNSQVMVGGKKVGVVEYVHPQQQLKSGPDGKERLVTSVLIFCRIDREVLSGEDGLKIYTNASATTNFAFFGGGSINLFPGGKNATKGDDVVPELLAPDNHDRPIIGKPHRTTEEILEEVHRGSRQLADVSEKVNTLLADGTIQKSVTDSLAALSNTAKNLDQILENLKPGLEKVGPTLESTSKIVETAAAMVEENRTVLREILENTKGITASTREFMEKRLDSLAANLEKLSAHLTELAATTNDVLDENRGNLNVTLTNLRETSFYVKDLSAKLRRDPSIIIWGTSDADNAADRQPVSNTTKDDFKLRDTGRLPPRERD